MEAQNKVIVLNADLREVHKRLAKTYKPCAATTPKPPYRLPDGPEAA